MVPPKCLEQCLVLVADLLNMITLSSRKQAEREFRDPRFDFSTFS